jgi:hypothetical protein
VSITRDVRAVVLLRAGTRRDDVSRGLAAMEGVCRVHRIQGPYDLIVHVAGRDQVEVIATLPGVTAAEVCWLSRP